MLSTFRLAPYAAISLSLTAWVVLLALQQRANFYAAAVYLSKSNACMLILWNFGIFSSVCFGKVLQQVLFGPLRLIEVEHLNERVWYAVTESLLALTIFREEFDTTFVMLFVSLLFVKIFHWLAGDRVDSMEQTPDIPRLFHVRMVATLLMISTVDCLLVIFGCESILLEGPSVMIMFVSEYLILLATAWSTSAKYALHTIDLSSDVPWESKSVLLFYVDLVTDFLKLATYLAFFSFILTFYGLPLNILRDVYMTTRSFIRKCKDLHRYKQATQNMDARYPNATQAEMDAMSDKTCIICREDMSLASSPAHAQNNADGQTDHNAPRRGWLARFKPQRKPPNETPKRLPCGHVFHFHCLKSWLERQQTCPTCRRSILSPSTTRPAPVAGAQGAHAAAPQQPNAQPQQRQDPAQARTQGPSPQASGVPAHPDPVQEAWHNVQRPLPSFLRPSPLPEAGRTRRPASFVHGSSATHRPSAPIVPSADNPLWQFLNTHGHWTGSELKGPYKIPVVAFPEYGIPESLNANAPLPTARNDRPSPQASDSRGTNLKEKDLPRLIPLSTSDAGKTLQDRIASLEETQRHLSLSIEAMKGLVQRAEEDSESSRYTGKLSETDGRGKEAERSPKPFRDFRQT